MKKRSLISIGIMVVGIALMVIGYFQGDVDEVLFKGIMICMECIGLG